MRVKTAPALTPYQSFMRNVAFLAAHRPAGASWATYERLKREFQHAVPDASHEQHQAAMQAIARAAGV